MKRIGLLLTMVLLSTGMVSAQGMKLLEFQVGYLSPKDTKAGMILGGNYGISIDERVDLSLGLSYFHKGYSKETEVAGKSTTGSGSKVGTIQQTLEYSTTLLPITANATVHIPFQPPWGLYVGGSLAYEFLFDKYTNHETKTSESLRLSGFGWIARAGMEWSIGSRSSVTLEAFYNSCKPSGNKKEVEGIPTWDEVNVSGLGFRAGFRVELY
jgi:hypothetical protein